MNFYAIEQAILDHSWEEYSSFRGEHYRCELDWHELWCDSPASEPYEIPGLGTLRVVETVGGEGEGDHAHVVVSITDSEGVIRYYKKDGYHSSYVGTEFDGDFNQVEPVETTVIVYKPV